MRNLHFTGIPRIRIRRGPSAPSPETRHQMIAHTNRFLSRALGKGVNMPRIPRRRVDQGGFTKILKHPGARAAVAHFWHQLLGRR